VRTKEQA